MLSDTAQRLAKTDEKPTKMYDEKGLYILLTPSGGKLWRFKYRFDFKEKTLTFGAYPEVTIAKARELRDEARATLREDITHRLTHL